MNYCQRRRSFKTLQGVLQQGQPTRLSYADLIEIGWRASKSLAALHQRRGPCHDLLPSMLTPRGNLLAGEHEVAPLALDLTYLAPEYRRWGLLLPPSNVYSLGVILWELACGRRPQPERGYFPALPAACPVAFEALLWRMLMLDHTQRPDAQHCVAFFKEMRQSVAILG